MPAPCAPAHCRPSPPSSAPSPCRLPATACQRRRQRTCTKACVPAAGDGGQEGCGRVSGDRLASADRAAHRHERRLRHPPSRHLCIGRATPCPPPREATTPGRSCSSIFWPQAAGAERATASGGAGWAGPAGGSRGALRLSWWRRGGPRPGEPSALSTGVWASGRAKSGRPAPPWPAVVGVRCSARLAPLTRPCHPRACPLAAPGPPRPSRAPPLLARHPPPLRPAEPPRPQSGRPLPPQRQRPPCPTRETAPAEFPASFGLKEWGWVGRGGTGEGRPRGRLQGGQQRGAGRCPAPRNP